MSGEKLDEFIFFENYDIGEIKEYKKIVSGSEYMSTNIFINGKKYEKNSEINKLINRNNNYEEKILKTIIYRNSGGFTINNLLVNLLSKLIKEGLYKYHIQRPYENSIYVKKEEKNIFILIKQLTYFYLDFSNFCIFFLQNAIK